MLLHYSCAGGMWVSCEGSRGRCLVTAQTPGVAAAVRPRGLNNTSVSGGHPPKARTFVVVVIVRSLSCVLLFVTPWTATCQASLSFTIFWSLLELMFIESVIPSNHLILCRFHLLLPSVIPSIRVLSRLFESGGQSIGASALVLPMNVQD